MIDGEMTNDSTGLCGGLSLTGLSYPAFRVRPAVSYVVMSVPNWPLTGPNDNCGVAYDRRAHKVFPRGHHIGL